MDRSVHRNKNQIIFLEFINPNHRKKKKILMLWFTRVFLKKKKEKNNHIHLTEISAFFVTNKL